MFCSSAVSVCE